MLSFWPDKNKKIRLWIRKNTKTHQTSSMLTWKHNAIILTLKKLGCIQKMKMTNRLGNSSTGTGNVCCGRKHEVQSSDTQNPGGCGGPAPSTLEIRLAKFRVLWVQQGTLPPINKVESNWRHSISTSDLHIHACALVYTHRHVPIHM